MIGGEAAELEQEEIERRFEAVFESSEDRDRIFEEFQQCESYKRLAMMLYLR